MMVVIVNSITLSIHVEKLNIEIDSEFFCYGFKLEK